MGVFVRSCCGVIGGLLVAANALGQATTQPAAAPASGEPTRLPEVVVRGRETSLIGIAPTASTGTVGAEQLQTRPLQRPGEVLETVPGIIITQHSGDGKANQFFLRGFNLDHGTDFSVDVNGVPVNMPTHGHGQGYADLSFIIPELIERVDYKKGPYYAEEGDFSSAGAIDISYYDALPTGLFIIEGGTYGYGRTLFADSTPLNGGADGTLLYALELFRHDGPWENPNDYERLNGVLKYSRGDAENGFKVTASTYSGGWDATDQIPERAVRDGTLDDRFDTLDDSSGGNSQRHQLSLDFHSRGENSASSILLYAFYYDLDLWSNFTYFLADPVNGDQFLQSDERFTSGLKAEHTIFGEFWGSESDTTFGLQARNDLIENGLYNTADRDILSTTREDEVVQTSVGAYVRNKTRWTEWLRTVAGVRGDFYDFDVDANFDGNSGHTDDAIVSPKGSLIFGPWWQTEFYLSGGLGFHSNDGRGTTTRIDPATGDAVDAVDALVRTEGAEFGIRTTAIEGLQSTVSFWVLESDSELLFIGDAGTTEASRPSRRYGVEFANYYAPADWISFDLDVSLSEAEFVDSDPAGDEIPGSIQSVVAAGVALRDPHSGLFGSVRLRYFGARPLTEDGEIESDPSALVSAELGYRFDKTWTVRAQVFNLFDSAENDIEYYYPSRMRGEPVGPDDGGYNDIHFHPAERFAFRLALIAQF